MAGEPSYFMCTYGTLPTDVGRRPLSRRATWTDQRQQQKAHLQSHSCLFLWCETCGTCVTCVDVIKPGGKANLDHFSLLLRHRPTWIHYYSCGIVQRAWIPLRLRCVFNVYPLAEQSRI